MHQLARSAIQLLVSLPIAATLLLTQPAVANTLVLKAIDDFPNRSAGDAPFYAETSRDALAINAADPLFRNVFAKATTTFSGESGEYDVTLVGLAELDGETVYRFSVNDELIDTAQNPETSVDFMPIAHRFTNIMLNTGDQLAVESIANSNELIPENGHYAFARGRWTELRLTPAGDEDIQLEKVSLITNASSLNSTVSVGDTVAIDYAIINDDAAGATATNVRVQFNIPDNFVVTEPQTCTTLMAIIPGEQVIRCSLSQVAPGAAIGGGLLLNALTEGNGLTVHATAIANETDITGSDNRASVAFDVEPESEISIDEPSENETPETPETTDSVDSANTNNTEPSNSSNNETSDNAASSDNEFLTVSNTGDLPSSANNNTSQTLPESATIQSVALNSNTNEIPITTGGALSLGSSFALLFFISMNRRRYRQ